MAFTLKATASFAVFILFIGICTMYGVAGESCQSKPLLTDKSKIPDSSFSATKNRDESLPKMARMTFPGKRGWSPGDKPHHLHYLTIDLRRPYVLCAVGVKGGALQFSDYYPWEYGYVEKFEFSYKYKYNWISNVLEGAKSEKKNTIDPPVIADIVRFIPQTFSGHFPIMKVELYGFTAARNNKVYGKQPATCNKPLGMENNGIDSKQIYASSEETSKHSKKYARLNADYSWRATKLAKGEYLQVDLGQMMKVTGISVQGDYGFKYHWVTLYKIQYCSDGKSWIDYQTLKGPRGITDIATSWFNHKLDARYIRVVVEGWHGGISMRIELYGCHVSCDRQPVGLENGYIKHSQMTASSTLNEQTVAKNARLNYKTADAWCASTGDNNAYLQVDLRVPYVLCAVATQGNRVHDQMVTSYIIQTSFDGKSFTNYKVKDEVKLFDGNSDSKTIAKNYFDSTLVGRYLRFLPKSYIGAACMRLELYGVEKLTCDRMASGIVHTFAVPNYRMTATSSYSKNKLYHPPAGRVNNDHCWEPEGNSNNDYLQIDLGDPHFLCAVGMQGNGKWWNSDERTENFKISFSIDGKTWKSYPKVLSGNTFPARVDPLLVSKNVFDHLHLAKFVRIYPQEYINYKCVRAELYGLKQGWKESLGLETLPGKDKFPDKQITASSSLDSHHAPSMSRLYGSHSWCGKKGSFLKIDLGEVKQFSGIAVQGDKSKAKWVELYDLVYGYEFDDMKSVMDIETGLKNQHEVKVHWLPSPVGARYIQVIPKRWKSGPCMRIELYVNDRAPPVKIVSLDMQGKLTAAPGSHVTIKCSAAGDKSISMKWLLSGIDVTDRSCGSVYADGMTTSELRVNFTSVLEIKSEYKCSRIARLKMKCTTQVDCQSEMKNANGDRKSYTIEVIIDLPAPRTDPPITKQPSTLPPTPAPTKKKVHKKKHNKPLKPAGQENNSLLSVLFGSASTTASVSWALIVSVAFGMLGWIVG